MRILNCKALLAAAGLAMAFAVPAASAQEQVRVASFTGAGAIGVKDVMIPWMEAVQADIGDQVKLTGFWGGSLGKSPFQQYDLVKNGVADVAWVVAGYSPGRFPQLHVLELPFMARNGVEAAAVAWDLYEKNMIQGVDEFKVLTLWSPTGDNLHLREPIKTLEDVNGLKIRTGSAAHAQIMEALGAVPQTIGPTEVNDALARGAVDGLIQGLTGMKTFGTFNVVKQTYEVPLGNISFLLLMNKKKWESLPKAVQEAMDKHAGQALGLKGGKVYDEETAIIREAKIKEGYPIVTPTEAELDAYRDRFIEVHKKWIEATPNGQAVYDEFKTFLAEYRKSNS